MNSRICPSSEDPCHGCSHRNIKTPTVEQKSLIDSLKIEIAEWKVSFL